MTEEGVCRVTVLALVVTAQDSQCGFQLLMHLCRWFSQAAFYRVQIWKVLRLKNKTLKPKSNNGNDKGKHPKPQTFTTNKILAIYGWKTEKRFLFLSQKVVP